MKKRRPMTSARLKELRDEADKNPSSAEAHLKYGTALLRVGLATKAEESLRRAVEIDKDYAEAWSNLGGALLSRWDFAGCVDANRRALTCNPDLLQAHFNLGLAHLYKGDAKEVISCFARVVELEPTNAGAHYHLAVGLHADGQTEAAQMSLSRAMALGHTPEPEFLKALERHGGPGPVPTIEIGSDPKGSNTTQ